ncbi:hypothetical protein SK854_35605 [Lentzea sp. BCCO 10_0061]|uniref:Uncharacterized protein n=1 Tax=Lentzea sokolovensis TaxID=3095429 RepID=A0ABU4V952_9PSEU|nr:hypothetical protein [Lentzea sp. BCCO 10_0061]MDX8147483.1 hypothetical protein [Lentzea sp. BCCO 10_0061]
MLFDLDGVLADSTVAAERAWTHEFGADPGQVLRGVHGRRSADTVRLHVPAVVHAHAVRRIDAIEIADAGSTEPIPGGREGLGCPSGR